MHRLLKKRGIFRAVKLYSRITGATADISAIYDETFFQKTSQKEAASAGAVADILIAAFRPQTVIDIGCGIGIFLKAFQDRSVSIFGCDGSKIALEENLVDRGNLELRDLRRPCRFDGRWDLCLCFEVAEHLPPEYAPQLVRTLTQTSDLIAFTAASPGQGGTHHVNERPQKYWQELFEVQGFSYDADVTDKLRKQMRRENVVFWIAQNLMIFSRKSSSSTGS